MEIIYNEGTAQLPRIILDKENNKFEISGQSIPEDVISFYTPILKWLDEYILSPNEKTHFNVKMVYFNTSSSKMIYEMINRFETVFNKGYEVKILWHFASDDEDMEESGRKFEEMFPALPFDFINYDD